MYFYDNHMVYPNANNSFNLEIGPASGFYFDPSLYPNRVSTPTDGMIRGFINNVSRQSNGKIMATGWACMSSRSVHIDVGIFGANGAAAGVVAYGVDLANARSVIGVTDRCGHGPGQTHEDLAHGFIIELDSNRLSNGTHTFTAYGLYPPNTTVNGVNVSGRVKKLGSINCGTYTINN